MDTQSTGEQSDDQELAKALAGVNDKISNQVAGTSDDALAFEETTAPSGAIAGSPLAPPAPVTPTLDPAPAATLPEPVVPAAPAVPGELDNIKKDALNELRPLVDKLNVSSEEKFDTYLLLIRSTDDKTLIEPAHEAAKGIADEARRAQALLDIIKEIDYLSSDKAA
jgi:hypothetical protein